MIRRCQILVTLALQIVISFSAIALFDNIAIAETTTPKIIAYDINKNIDQQRKEETQKRYGDKVGQVVDDALKNNEEGPNSQYKIKPEDSPVKKAEKVVEQVKDKGLVDVARKGE